MTLNAHISNTKQVYIFHIEIKEDINERGKEF
jgi:hypothetical protein